MVFIIKLLAVWHLLALETLGREDNWVWSGEVKCGEGVGYCVASEKGTKSIHASIEVRTPRTNSTTFRIRSPRAHCYLALFALDSRRDVIEFISQVKARPGDKIELSLSKLPIGGTVHALVASNAVDRCPSPEYRICIEGDALVEGHEDGCGWRGLASDHEARAVAAEEIKPPQRLLCLDGGGSRGVVPIAILQRAEERSQVRVREKFDFFAGTSTGAIIAAGLAIAELPTAIVDALYRDLARLIFGSRGLNASQRGKRLHAILSAVFGEKSTLGRSAYQSRRALFVATDASTSRLRPLVMRNYQRGLDPDNEHESEISLVKAILASAAAPPFFPAVESGRKRLLDGALIANNPTLVALIDAAALGIHDPEVVVSLGTGIAPVRAVRRTNGIFSAIDFLTGVINLLVDTDGAHDLVDLYLRANRAFRRSTTRYHRIDVVLDHAHLDLTEGDRDALSDLKALALEYLRREKPHHWRALLRELDENSNVVDLDDLVETRLLLRSEETLPLQAYYDAQQFREEEDEGTPSSSENTSFRNLRKRAAKLTGMHGFFSGKKQNPHRRNSNHQQPMRALESSSFSPSSSSSSSHAASTSSSPSSSAVVVMKATAGGGSSLIGSTKNRRGA